MRLAGRGIEMGLLAKVFQFGATRDFKIATDLFIYHNDYEGALQAVEHALKQDPTNYRAAILYADVLFCLHREMEALGILDEVIAKKPALPEAYISKASVLEVFGRTRESLACCRLALQYIDTSKSYLLQTVYEQKISLLLSLKSYRAAENVLLDAEMVLDGDEYEYLLCTYQRDVSRARKKHQQISLPSTSVVSPAGGTDKAVLKLIKR